MREGGSVGAESIGRVMVVSNGASLLRTRVSVGDTSFVRYGMKTRWRRDGTVMIGGGPVNPRGDPKPPRSQRLILKYLTSRNLTGKPERSSSERARVVISSERNSQLECEKQTTEGPIDSLDRRKWSAGEKYQ